MKHLLIIITLITCLWANAQVPKNVIVELFTNSRCSTCGALEPGIMNTIQQYPNLIQIAYYPSAPYSSCFFSQQNKTEYDGRTKNYAIYGSTPHVLVQGVEVNNMLDTASINAYLNQLSNFEIKIVHEKTSSTTAQFNTTIIKKAIDNTTQAKLYLAIGEDSVSYAAPNGINKHYGVMRKALTDSSGMEVLLPVNVGDSLVISKNYSTSGTWNHSLLTGFAFLANTTNKSIINANKQKLNIGTFSGVESHQSTDQLSLYPNPIANGFINVNSAIETDFIIADMAGKTVQKGILRKGENQIRLSNSSPGVYLVKSNNRSIRFSIN
ncbi:MAG: T9SS type A sorting domain-containing protein [Chitinophagales bacterium]|nr:T9SS type A sorting domain-containing protein [Chitinophagales bacterium]